MSIAAPWNELFEDKKCRICGLADIGNINIYNDKILRMKITTVYPIVLHKDDPLPRNICRKCVSTVSSMYNDVQRVIKLQSKWTQNVRANEPRNSFLQSLDLLENATEAIKNLMTATFGTTLPNETINRLITTALSQVEKSKSTIDHEPSETLPLNGEDHKSPQIKEEANEEKQNENQALSKTSPSKKSSLPANPLLTVMCNYCPLQFESLARLSLHQNIHFRLQIRKLFQTKFLNKKSRRGRLISINDRQNIRCLNCWRIFDDNKCILEHWSKAECDFYCQICGKEYEQSPKMLREHVLVAHGISYKSLKTQRDRLTRKITSSSKPKHQTDIAANKNLKSKKECPPLSLPQVAHTQKNADISKYFPTAPSHHATKSVKCRICSRAFQNFKACNSHMRAHKPPYAYGETAPLPDVDADAYIEVEHKNCKKKPAPIPQLPQTIITAPVTNEPPIIATAPVSNSSQCIPNSTETPKQQELGSIKETKQSPTLNTAPSEPTPKLPPSTAPRGIRMKFVSRRSDLNGSGPSIKVKPLSDLQSGQKHINISNNTPSIVNEVQNVLPATSPSIPLSASFVKPNIKDEPLFDMLL